MIYAYCRVSTKTQKLERQLENIKAYCPTAKVITEKQSGKQFESRTELVKLLSKVKTGDTIIFDSVSRLSRNTEDGLQIYFDLYNKGIELVFLNEPYINTATYRTAVQSQIATVGNDIADLYINATNQALQLIAKQQIIIAFEQAEKEGKDISQRVKDGMHATQENGLTACEKISQARTGKRYESDKKKQIKAFILKASKSFGGNLSDKEIIEQLSISKKTYYNYKKELV